MNGFSKTEQELWGNWEYCFRYLHIILQKIGPITITQNELNAFLDKKEDALFDYRKDPLTGNIIIQAIFAKEDAQDD